MIGPQHSLLVGHGELMRRSSGQIKGFVTAGVARQKSVPAQRPIASNKVLINAGIVMVTSPYECNILE